MGGDDPLILLLYVDDLFIIGGERPIAACKKDFASEYEVTDIELMHYFLGLEVWQKLGHIFLGQGKYVVDILRRFRMEDSRPMSTLIVTNWKKLQASKGELVDPTLYRQLIGMLMYLVNTRPDLCFVMNTLSQFMKDPRRVHWIVAKHVLRYLAGTMDYGMHYRRSNGVILVEFTYSYLEGSVIV